MPKINIDEFYREGTEETQYMWEESPDGWLEVSGQQLYLLKKYEAVRIAEQLFLSNLMKQESPPISLRVLAGGKDEIRP